MKKDNIQNQSQHHHPETEDISEKYVMSGAFFSIFIHIFCCGIPAVLAILSGFGVYVSVPFFEHEHNGKGEIIMFAISGIFLLISFIIYFRHNHCNCGHKHHTNEKWSKVILFAATGLYLFGIYTHFIAESM